MGLVCLRRSSAAVWPEVDDLLAAVLSRSLVFEPQSVVEAVALGQAAAIAGASFEVVPELLRLRSPGPSSCCSSMFFLVGRAFWIVIIGSGAARTNGKIIEFAEKNEHPVLLCLYAEKNKPLNFINIAMAFDRSVGAPPFVHYVRSREPHSALHTARLMKPAVLPVVREDQSEEDMAQALVASLEVEDAELTMALETSLTGSVSEWMVRSHGFWTSVRE